MKRAELVKGEAYVVAAPSVTLDGPYAGTIKKVIVLDTEPNFVDRYLGWSSRESLPKAKVPVPGLGELHVPDKTRSLDDPQYSSDPAEAKRLVRVLVLRDTKYGRYDLDVNAIETRALIIQAVPISQVRMGWAEYEAMRVEAEAERKREQRRRRDRERAEQAVKDDRQARADALNELLLGTDVSARVILDQVAIIGSPQALLDAASVLANA